MCFFSSRHIQPVSGSLSWLRLAKVTVVTTRELSFDSSVMSLVLPSLCSLRRLTRGQWPFGLWRLCRGWPQTSPRPNGAKSTKRLATACILISCRRCLWFWGTMIVHPELAPSPVVQTLSRLVRLTQVVDARVWGSALLRAVPVLFLVPHQLRALVVEFIDFTVSSFRFKVFFCPLLCEYYLLSFLIKSFNFWCPWFNS